MIQTLKGSATFCPIPNCPGLNLLACPYLGQEGKCRIMEPGSPIIEPVAPVIQKPKARGLKKLLGS
jgi:hypothetical protein